MIATRLHVHIDGLVQERRNSSALAIELRLTCTNPSLCISMKEICHIFIQISLNFVLWGSIANQSVSI